MLKRTLVLCLIALSLCGAASAKVRRGRGRPRENKIFAAKSNSVALENQAADAMGIPRYLTQEAVDAAVQRGELVPLDELWISKNLPSNRRYARPETVRFMQHLSDEFWYEFGVPLIIDSAVRPATVQRKLTRWNSSAAPAYGEHASSHERGCTVDISKHLTKAQQQWLVTRLLYYYALDRVFVIQERVCFHIFVQGEQQ